MTITPSCCPVPADPVPVWLEVLVVSTQSRPASQAGCLLTSSSSNWWLRMVVGCWAAGGVLGMAITPSRCPVPDDPVPVGLEVLVVSLQHRPVGRAGCLGLASTARASKHAIVCCTLFAMLATKSVGYPV